MLSTLALVAALAAPDTQAHDHGLAPDRLGTVDFPISCDKAARAHFDRAVALLHSFWYAEADAAFARAAAADPRCAMAQWGIAMSQYQQFWEPPAAAALARGAEAAQKAAALGAPSARERGFIGAIGVFYKDHATVDHRTRAKAYEKAMEDLHRQLPDDLEAAAFHGLALLSTRPLDDRTHAQEIRAGEILEGVFTKAPDHPGAAHYVIHSFDSPELAPRALNAALAYSKIAPASPHALHMPSHIFVRLGRWEDTVQSNLASSAAARAHAEKAGTGTSAFDDLHALDYLEYAYLQRGEEEKATAVVQRVRAVAKLDAQNLAAAYALAAVPARYALERRRWEEAAALEVPAGFPWARYPYAEAVVHFARGVGFARGGKVEGARAALARLAELQAATPEAQKAWRAAVEAQRKAVEGWIAFAEGRTEDALATLRAAADLEDAAEKHPVTPGAPVPAREMLGDMLLAAKRAGPALAEYEVVMRACPNRFGALAGAARAAEESGDAAKAGAYYASLLKLTAASAAAPRPELDRARAFLKIGR
jgi:tetratricopeptide (TPR) repeat protein